MEAPSSSDALVDVFSPADVLWSGHEVGRSRNDSSDRQPTAQWTIDRSRTDLLTPGPRFLALYLLALPVAVVAFASVGRAQLLSGFFAAVWLVVAPLALFSPRAAKLLPAAGAAFLLLSVALLPFNSFAFVVDLWAGLAMLVSSAPRHRLRS